MDPKKLLAKLETTAATWRTALEGHGDDAFARDRQGRWTLGQICDHVVNTSDTFLNGAEALTRGEGEEHGGSAFAWVMTRIGSFPPFRFKVPPNLPPAFQRLASPQSITKAEALDRFDTVLQRTRSLCDAVASAPTGLRSKHPAAGWVNAAQWYQLSEMHMRHHLRQLRRMG